MDWQKKILGSKINRIMVSLSITLLLILVGTRGSSSAQEIKGTNTPKGIYIPVVYFDDSHEDPPGPVPEDMEWLQYLNSYREMAGLPLLSVDTVWNYGSWLHSRYMVKNDVIGHNEDPERPWYTRDGDQTARTSNLVASHNSTASDQYAIDLWMQAPFHSVGILDPALHKVGFGSYRETDGGLQMGATLDILRGLGELPAPVSYPVVWPGDGATVPLTKHFSEYPDPLSSCPGYEPPAGLPIILQIGPGNLIPNVTAHSFKRGSESLEHCVFDETSYHNPAAGSQSLGRAILGSRDAIVLIPKNPLLSGETYSVSLTVNGKTTKWSFSVSDQVSQMENPREGEFKLEKFLIR